MEKRLYPFMYVSFISLHYITFLIVYRKPLAQKIKIIVKINPEKTVSLNSENVWYRFLKIVH